MLKIATTPPVNEIFSVILLVFSYIYFNQACDEHGQCRVHCTMLINRLDANWNMTIVALRRLRQVNGFMWGNSSKQHTAQSATTQSHQSNYWNRNSISTWCTEHFIKKNTKNASKSIAYGQRRARAQRTFTYERMDNKTLELVSALSCIRSNQYDEVMKKASKQAHINRTATHHRTITLRSAHPKFVYKRN